MISRRIRVVVHRRRCRVLAGCDRVGPLRLLIATTNPGKIREFRQMLDAGSGIRCYRSHRTPRNCPPVEETGQHFPRQRLSKAASMANAQRSGPGRRQRPGGGCLDGKPGVSVPAGQRSTKPEPGMRITMPYCFASLRKFRAERRTARFICSLALADPREGSF